jgi:integrase/recombinase XerD
LTRRFSENKRSGLKTPQTALKVANSPALALGPALPPFIAQAGPKARVRFVEFLTAHIRNPNTRDAYARDIARFCQWCDAHGITLRKLKPVLVAAYIEELGRELAAPSVKRHLAAIRMLCDWFVLGQVLVMNPAASVRGPKHVVKRGKTPILDLEDLRGLLRSIDGSTLAGRRDRALIGVMLLTFARVSAAVGMQVGDYRAQVGKIRLREKGGKRHEVPVHRDLARYLDEYLAAAKLPKDGPLFPALLGRSQTWSGQPMGRGDALRMIKRRAARAGLAAEVCCHSFRGAGITAYLAAGGTIERAQAMAAHESTQTTKLYDRTKDEITAAEFERITL